MDVLLKEHSMIKSLLVTGYKSHELSVFNEKHPGIKFIKKALEKNLLKCLEEGLEWVIVSGQLGVEMWAAEVVLELKKTDFQHLKLAVLTPFLNQEKNWAEQRQEYYQSIIAEADYVNSITKIEYEGPWQFKAKNRFLLDNTDGMLILFDEEKDGSPKFIMEEALKRVETSEYEVFQITSYDLQLIVEEEQFTNSEF
jgi:uncharacterized phage-like protein YoqJ